MKAVDRGERTFQVPMKDRDERKHAQNHAEVVGMVDVLALIAKRKYKPYELFDLEVGEKTLQAG